MKGDRIHKPPCLSEFLQIQNDFQKKYYPLEKICMSSLASAIASESMEIWAASGGKWWYKNQHVDREKIKEESMDIFHFLLLLWLKLGMNEYDILDLYKMKMRINIQRQKSTDTVK